MKSCDLDNPEQVKRFIAEKEVKDSRKEKLVNCYHNYVEWRGLHWEKPVYRRDSTLPFISLEKEIDQLIGVSRSGGAISCMKLSMVLLGHVFSWSSHTLNWHILISHFGSKFPKFHAYILGVLAAFHI